MRVTITLGRGGEYLKNLVAQLGQSLGHGLTLVPDTRYKGHNKTLHYVRVTK